MFTFSDVFYGGFCFVAYKMKCFAMQSVWDGAIYL